MGNVFLLGLTSLLTDISTEMVYPLLPLFLTATLGASPAVVGLIEGIAESLASLLKVFSGYLSDLWRRRKPMAIAGYASSTAGKLLLYLATSWWWVLAGRAIDRFGKGIRTAPRDALIADSSPAAKRGRYFGLHRMLDTLGAAGGVLAAYFLLSAQPGSYRRIFLLSLLPAFLGVLILFFVREKAPTKEPSQAEAAEQKAAGPQAGPSVLRLRWSELNPRLRAFLLFTFLFTLGNSSNQFLLLRARHLGFAPAAVLLAYLLYNLVYALVSYPAGRLSDRVGRKHLLVAGYATYGLVYLGFALSSQSWQVWALFALYGLYIGLTEGVEKALVADVAPAELRATLIGLHATLVGLGLFPASLLAGLL
ncbi:MAG: MFS transporter, partial [Bacillota bacterium]|nr:MFS transporter [Bacillota bacterium]